MTITHLIDFVDLEKPEPKLWSNGTHDSPRDRLEFPLN